MNTDLKEMKDLVALLNEAGRAYYAESREIMSNREYDALYLKLEAMEKESGIVLSDSPTIHVGAEVRSDLPKVMHTTPMLSLDKTKDTAALAAFAGSHKTLLSWKMDGLTIVLTYDGGTLVQAVTRGNGRIGEDVTPNARRFRNVPLRIPYQGHLVLRGEAIIHYSDFEEINSSIEDADARYKNPRNLCSGAVRQLNPEITAARRVYLYAFSLVEAPGVDFANSRRCQLEWLRSQGFTVVEYREVTEETVPEAVAAFSEAVSRNDFPSDGLVALYDDIAYGESLGTTAKYPRNAYAFKWQDETRETILREVEWSPSRTGLINPVAVFDPVELEGTTVRRASLHNVSVLRALKLGIGDTITVYKANMIIPQIAANLTGSDTLVLPERCPVCGGKTAVVTEGEGDEAVMTLHCQNPDCQAKKIRSFGLFVSRDGMNIDGLSEMTLEKLIDRGFIRDVADIFCLKEHEEAIADMEGFGPQSAANLIAAVDKASVTTLTRLITALGIPGIGSANARILCRHFQDDIDALRHAGFEELAGIRSVGPITAEAIESYFRDEARMAVLDRLLPHLTIEKEVYPTEDASPIAGKTFVITGTLATYANRKALQKVIEDLGGRVTGSVTGHTDYLINNDSLSTSSKNKTAMKLGIPIITEKEFKEMIDHAD